MVVKQRHVINDFHNVSLCMGTAIIVEFQFDERYTQINYILSCV